MSALGENILLPTGRHYKVEFSLYYAHYHWAHKTYEPLPPPPPPPSRKGEPLIYGQIINNSYPRSYAIHTGSLILRPTRAQLRPAAPPQSILRKHALLPPQTAHSVRSTGDSRPLHYSPNGTAISIRAHLKLKITPLSLCPSLNQHHKSAKPTPVRLKPAQRSPVQLK